MMPTVEDEIWREIECMKKQGRDAAKAVRNGEIKDDDFEDFMKEMELYEKDPDAWRKQYGSKIPHYQFEER